MLLPKNIERNTYEDNELPREFEQIIIKNSKMPVATLSRFGSSFYVDFENKKLISIEAPNVIIPFQKLQSKDMDEILDQKDNIINRCR
jgi:hypothetical protein